MAHQEQQPTATSDLAQKVLDVIDRLALLQKATATPDTEKAPLQRQVLLYLLQRDPAPATVSDLARDLQLAKATVSVLVSALKEQGRIVKEAAHHDARSSWVKLTAEGRALARAEWALRQPLTEVLAAQVGEKLAPFYGSLLTALQGFVQAGYLPAARMCLSCKYFQASSPGQMAYCHLLEQDLPTEALRLHCPEHKPA